MGSFPTSSDPDRAADLPADFDLGEALAALRAAPDFASFRRSSFHRRHGAALDAWVGKIRLHAPPRPPAPPPAPRDGAARGAASERILRIVQWNVEQGKAWDRLVEAVETTPQLRGADLWTLNEADLGTARVANRDVARELGQRLGLYSAFVANYLELTKGPGPDGEAPGENAIGLHGIALLSRWPLADAGFAAMPEIFDYFRFPLEKRYGVRKVLWATVRHPRGDFRLATTHLEVRSTPRQRAAQIAAAVAALPAGPAWLTGDWNTHTFRRGGRLASALEFLRLRRTDPAAFEALLLDPWEREPLLRVLARSGFHLGPWNDRQPTVREVLSRVEELEQLPAPLRDRFRRAFSLESKVLRMRLDWIAARGPWRPAPAAVAAAAEAAPAAPADLSGSPAGSAAWTGVSLGPEGTRASDHAPIGVTAAWEDEPA
ncbi:MAG: endonuclease/exonuclease/phosphatase family protein [Candidatus Eisenbacteria bacterium]